MTYAYLLKYRNFKKSCLNLDNRQRATLFTDKLPAGTFHLAPHLEYTSTSPKLRIHLNLQWGCAANCLKVLLKILLLNNTNKALVCLNNINTWCQICHLDSATFEKESFETFFEAFIRFPTLSFFFSKSLNMTNSCHLQLLKQNIYLDKLNCRNTYC